MKTSRGIFFGTFGFLLGVVSVICMCFLLFVGSFFSLATSLSNQNLEASQSALDVFENNILVVKVRGIILNESGTTDPFNLTTTGVTYGYDIKQELINAAKDDSVKAVILDVDSPGGTVVGSNAISDGVEYFKEQTGRPVIGFGSGLIASGGYWSIVPSDTIIVDVGSSVGSIGVLSGQFTYYKDVIAEGEFLGGSVETKGGIEKFYISAGKGKDLGDPYRKPTQQEIDLIQRQADRVYDDFVVHVASMRSDLSEKEIKQEIGAYTYDPEKALDLKLIDKIGNRQDAIKHAAEAAGLSEGEYGLKEVPNLEINFFSSLLGISHMFAYSTDDFAANSAGCELMRHSIIAYHGNLSRVCNL